MSKLHFPPTHALVGCLMFLTSALCPGVSPVVLLTVGACFSSKAITTLTLSSELSGQTQVYHIHVLWCSQCEWTCLFTNAQVYSKRRVPHYMRRWLSCWDHSHRVHSPSCWPGSSGWGHSDHMSDLWHLVDTGIALWHAGTHILHDPHTGCDQYPESYTCILNGRMEDTRKACYDY